MSKWNELAHFLYSPEFWYADPLREIRGLTEEQLLWVPETKSLCAVLCGMWGTWRTGRGCT